MTVRAPKCPDQAAVVSAQLVLGRRLLLHSAIDERPTFTEELSFNDYERFRWSSGEISLQDRPQARQTVAKASAVE
jgi:hypothetical protein